MTDVHSPEQRSYNMSQIRSCGTKPELLIRSALWRRGFRYRVRTNLPGKPDIVFSGRKLVIFIDGCFWHGCPEHFQLPATRQEFWRHKIEANRSRDSKVDRLLQEAGWQVYRVWEHEIRRSPEEVVATIVQKLLSLETQNS